MNTSSKNHIEKPQQTIDCSAPWDGQPMNSIGICYTGFQMHHFKFCKLRSNILSASLQEDKSWSERHHHTAELNCWQITKDYKSVLCSISFRLFMAVVHGGKKKRPPWFRTTFIFIPVLFTFHFTLITQATGDQRQPTTLRSAEDRASHRYKILLSRCFRQSSFRLLLQFYFWRRKECSCLS